MKRLGGLIDARRTVACQRVSFKVWRKCWLDPDGWTGRGPMGIACHVWQGP